MTAFKHLFLSFLAAWATSAVILAGAYLFFIKTASELLHFPKIAAFYAFYAGMVVLGAWVLVATPYFFLCIRKNRPQSSAGHVAAAVGSAIVAAGLLTRFDGDAWCMLGLIASASATVGVLALLRLHQSTIKNQTSGIINDSTPHQPLTHD